MNKAISHLRSKGYFIPSDLPYCTEEGKEYYIGHKYNKAGIVAIMEDESNYLLTKGELREMALTARTYGIEEVTLYTNYGLELHSRLETPLKTVGINRIKKDIN